MYSLFNLNLDDRSRIISSQWSLLSQRLELSRFHRRLQRFNWIWILVSNLKYKHMHANRTVLDLGGFLADFSGGLIFLLHSPLS